MRRADAAVRPRRGLTLIEVLVAVVILGFGVAAWSAMGGQAIDAMRTAQRHGAEYERASTQLTRVSLWSAGQFEENLGAHRVGALQVAVAKLDAQLFAVVIADSLGATMLSTTFYRRDTSAATPR